MRIFKITPKIEIVANAESQRDGFRHRATLVLNGKEVDSTTVHYINRTWESYEFQSVMKILVEKTSYLTAEEKAMVHKWLQGDRTDWSAFKTTSMVASLGDVFGQTTKEKNAWKTRMLKAGMENKGLMIPDDWDVVPEKDKEARLNAVIKMMGSVGNKNGEYLPAVKLPKGKKAKLKSQIKQNGTLDIAKETRVWD